MSTTCTQKQIQYLPPIRMAYLARALHNSFMTDSFKSNVNEVHKVVVVVVVMYKVEQQKAIKKHQTMQGEMEMDEN